MILGRLSLIATGLISFDTVNVLINLGHNLQEMRSRGSGWRAKFFVPQCSLGLELCNLLYKSIEGEFCVLWFRCWTALNQR